MVAPVVGLFLIVGTGIDEFQDIPDNPSRLVICKDIHSVPSMPAELLTYLQGSDDGQDPVIRHMSEMSRPCTWASVAAVLDVVLTLRKYRRGGPRRKSMGDPRLECMSETSRD